MIIVGLTGGISNGKTTFAHLLNSQSRSGQHFETWELVAEVANALRAENPTHPAGDDIAAINRWLVPLGDIVSQCVHVPVDYQSIKLTSTKLADHPAHYVKLFEYLELVADQPALAHTDITADQKQTFRPLLQWLGGFLVANGSSGVWYDEILRRITLLQATNCDVVTVGGVRYPGDAERLRNAGGTIIEIQRPSLPLQDSQDLTERERDLITPDSLVLNIGSLADLKVCAAAVYHDLSRRTLATTYTSAGTPRSPQLQPVQN